MSRRAYIRRSAVLSAAFALALASCTTTPPPDTPAVAVQPAPAPGAAIAVAPPSYDPVPEPAGLAGIIRIGSPIADLVMLRDLLPAHTPFGKLASLGPQTVAEIFLGSLGKSVDVAAPLDVVILKDQESPIIGSLVLRDFEEARKTAAKDFDFVPGADGRIAVKPKRGARHAGMLEQMEMSCAVMRGGAPPIEHLVCAANPENLDLAGPYLARTIARKPAGVGLHFEMPESLFRSTIAEQKLKLEAQREAAETPSEAAGRRLGEEIGNQFGDDFKDAAMDLKLTPGGVSATVDLRFRSLTSIFSVALVGTKGSGTSPVFWKLPKDADLAFYLPGASPDAIRPIGARIWREIADATPDESFPREKAREMTDRLAKLMITGGPWMVAHGAVITPPPPLNGPRKDLATLYREARAAVSGWFVVSVPEPADTWTVNLHEITKLNGQAGKKKPASAAGAPPRAGGASPGPGGAKKRTHQQTTSTTQEVAVTPAEGLPKGAIHIVHHQMPNPDFVAQPGKPALEGAYDIHFFVAGNATDTWIAISENEATARLKLHEAMTGDAGTLADRAELAPLRSAPAGGVGFFSLGAIVTLMNGADTSDELVRSVAAMKKLRALPSVGSVPVLLSMAPSSGGGANDKEGATLRISALLPLAGAIDLVQWSQ